MRRPLFFAAVLASVTPLTPALGQSDDPQDVLYRLATVEADHEICGFPLTDEQRDVITQRREALTTRGDVSDADVASVREQVSGALERQRAEGLCRPDGAEAQAYGRRLRALGLL